VKRLCDVGGDRLLLGSILSEYPHVEGTLFDLPEVVEVRQAPSKGGPQGRIEIVGGDFFKTMPKRGGRLHYEVDHSRLSDEQCVKLLSACREAIAPEGKVLVVERVVGERQDDAFVKLVDLEMLVMTPRRARAHQRMSLPSCSTNSGLRLERIVPTESMLSVIERPPAAEVYRQLPIMRKRAFLCPRIGAHQRGLALTQSPLLHPFSSIRRSRLQSPRACFRWARMRSSLEAGVVEPARQTHPWCARARLGSLTSNLKVDQFDERVVFAVRQRLLPHQHLAFWRYRLATGREQLDALLVAPVVNDRLHNVSVRPFGHRFKEVAADDFDATLVAPPFDGACRTSTTQEGRTACLPHGDIR